MAAGSLAVLTGAVPKIGGDVQAFIASRQQTEWAAVWGQMEDEHPSEILRTKSQPGHRLGELYDAMLNSDPMIAGLWEKRWKAVVGLPYTIVPADSTPRAREIADLAMKAIEGVKNLETNLEHQLGGILRGVAFDEIQWGLAERGPLAGLYVPVEIVDRPMWRFGFKEGVLCVRRLSAQLEPVPPARFLTLRHGSKDTPWGMPLLDRLYWAHWLSLHGWKYFGVAVEKWAMPTVYGKYKRDNDATANQVAVDQVMAAIRDIQTEYGFAIPDDFTIDLLQSQQSGVVSYEAFLGMLDRHKALVLLGEVDTSGLAKGPGSYAKSRVSNDVRIETIAMDATELANSLTDDFLRPFVAVNFGPDEPVPWWEFEVEEADDRAARQAGVRAVLDRGLPVPESYFYRVHQAPLPRPGERVVTGPFLQVPSPMPISTTQVAAPDAPGDWSDKELVN